MASDSAPVQLRLFADPSAPQSSTSPSSGTGAPETEPAAPGRRPSTPPSPKTHSAQKTHSAERFRRRLEARLGKPVESLVPTRNRTRIVSAQRGQHGLRVRIHRCFLDASDSLLAAVADFLDTRSRRRRSAALARIRAHFEDHGRQDSRPVRAPTLVARGRHHDLEALRDRINDAYFDGSVDVRITWGRGAHGRGIAAPPRPARGRRPSTTRSPKAATFHIRLGSYHDRDRLVRIHPVLDQADVPAYVVESIVYHEMLHQVVPPEPAAQRRRVHGAEFRRRERCYERFEEAEAWLAANLERLARDRFSRGTSPAR